MSSTKAVEAKHTGKPGERWHRNIKPGRRYPTIFAGRNTHVAYAATSKSLSDAEIEANIDLICAAPELLAACEGLLNKYVSLVNSGDAGFWNPEEEAEVIAARSAIASARTLPPSDAEAGQTP